MQCALRIEFTVFLPRGIMCPNDIRELNKAIIAAGRYSKAGPQFYFALPLSQATRLLKDTMEQAKDESRLRKR